MYKVLGLTKEESKELRYRGGCSMSRGMGAKATPRCIQMALRESLVLDNDESDTHHKIRQTMSYRSFPIGHVPYSIF